MSPKRLFDPDKKQSDMMSSAQEALAMKQKIDEYDELRKKLTADLKEATAELNGLPGDAASERKELKGRIRDLQRKINSCDVEREMLKTEFTTHGFHMIDESVMPRKFNKALCIQNIRYLLSKKDVRLGDIERASGNSPGYLSRLEKPDNTTDPSIEFLMNAAEMLGVGLDELTKGKMEELSPNEEMLVAFLERLLIDTKNDELNWIVELDAAHSAYEKTGPQENCPHILYGMDVEVDEATGDTIPNGWGYSSRFFRGEEIIVCGTSYHVSLRDTGNEIYIMKCRASSNDTISQEPFYEMYHVDREKEVNPVCCSRYSQGKIAMELGKLYKQITESNNHVRLTKSTKSMMELYMN